MTIRDHITRLAQLNNEYANAKHEAATYYNEDLTAEELAADRRKLADRARQNYAQAVEGIKAQAVMARHHNDRALAKTPKAEGSTRDGWERAKMLLDAGRPLAAIVKHADPAMLHGITEWAPTYLEAQRPAESMGEGMMGGRKALDLSGLTRSVQSRWAELNQDADLSRALADAPDLAELDTALSHAEATAAGNDQAGGMYAAIDAQLARQQAGATLPEPEASNA